MVRLVVVVVVTAVVVIPRRWVQAAAMVVEGYRASLPSQSVM